MGESDDFRAMSDPDFLAECTRVREAMSEEFDRRARAAWAKGDAA